MALHYFIDGYNLIFSTDRFGTSKTGKDRLQTQRENLLRFLELARPASSAHNQITVVFDGREDVDSPPWRGKVRVIFSKGTDADAVIKQRVDDMANGRDAVVVTDDRDIQKWVRASKAKVMSCADFLALTTKSQREARAPAKTDLDSSSITYINDELKRLWKL